MPRKTLYLSEAQEATGDISHKYKVPYVAKFRGKWYEDMVYTDDLERLASQYASAGFRIMRSGTGDAGKVIIPKREYEYRLVDDWIEYGPVKN